MNGVVTIEVRLVPTAKQTPNSKRNNVSLILGGRQYAISDDMDLGTLENELLHGATLAVREAIEELKGHE